MKQFVCVIILICIIVSITGCHRTQNPANDNTVSSSSSDNKETPEIDSQQPVSQVPMVSVSLPVVTESIKADDGTVLLNYIYQDISLVYSDHHVADNIILDFLNRVDRTRSTSDTLLTAAKAAYTDSKNWNPYQCLITYEPIRIDSGVLSLFGTFSTYNGMSHPQTSYQTANYDFATGNALTLGDILTQSATPNTICNLVIESLTPQKDAKRLYPDFADTIQNHFLGNIADSEAWYFSAKGLCFYYAPYEIAPYSSGVIVAEIPYKKLLGIIKDAYFPGEKDVAVGRISAEKLTVENFDKFTQLSEIIFDTNGEKILLFTDKAVQNIRIEIGSWSASGATYTPQHTVLAAAGLTPGDAIMLQASWKEDLPSLRVTYQTDNGEFRFFPIVKNNQVSIQQG